MQAVRDGGGNQGSAEARARGHHHGPRRSRQDLAARRHPRSQCGRPRGRRHHPAHRRVPGGDERQARSSSSIPPVTKRSPACAPAAPRSPISSSWWWRRTTASCRRPSKPSTTPRRPKCRSSWRSTRSISPTRSRSASSSSSPIAACWRKIGAATRSWCRFPPSTQQNLDLLLEMILLVAEMQDLKANPSRPAMGTVIEAQLDRGRGPVATVLVRNGTLARRRFLHLRLGVRQGARHAERSRRADPQGGAVHAGGGARSGFAAGSRRRFPGGHRYRQGQADRQFPRSASARKRRWPSPAASPWSNCTSRCRPAKSRNCRSSSRPTWAVRPRCSPRRCRSSPTTRSRSA